MKKYKPTTASRRQMTTVRYKDIITESSPYRRLTKRLKTHAGRNSQGRITVRHQGGGNKKLYRLIDFRQTKYDQPAVVETIEYDPYRSAFISLIEYSDKTKSYILSPRGIKIGQKIIVSTAAP